MLLEVARDYLWKSSSSSPPTQAEAEAGEGEGSKSKSKMTRRFAKFDLLVMGSTKKGQRVLGGAYQVPAGRQVVTAEKDFFFL